MESTDISLHIPTSNASESAFSASNLDRNAGMGLTPFNSLSRVPQSAATLPTIANSAAIHGVQWNDRNGNGVQDAGEPGLAGVTVYLDQNRNGRLDAGELSTITDANGNYAFTNLAPGTYAVAIAPPIGWQQTSPLRADTSSLIPVTDRRDLIFDPLRNTLYMPTSAGKVERYDVTTHSLLTPWQVGNSLNGGDITPDSSALYIAENQVGATQGFIRKVNLADGTVKNLTFNLDYDNTPSDVAIGANGLAIFRGFGQWQSFRQIDLSTDTITARSDGGSIYGGGQISRSSDRSRFFITQDGISSGPVSTYNAVTNTFSTERDTNTYLGTNLSAVNRDGSLIAIEWGTGISILDRNLNSVENLTGVDGGLTFDPQRDILYAANFTTDQIIAFDTHTWHELYRLNIGEDIPSSDSWDTSSRPFGNGMMTVSADGHELFMATPSGVRMLDLLPVGTQLVTLTDGQATATVNFGAQQQVAPTSSIAGSLWNDTNGNGIHESNESGLADRTVYLDVNRNGILDAGEPTTTTNANGNYLFTDLAPGTYTVAEVVPTAWRLTTPLDSQSTLLPIADRRDLIFDPQRDRLYMTTSDGDVERYDVATGDLLTPWHVGNALNGGDITVDGNALYIAENQRGATQGFIRKVNLTDGTVKNLTFDFSYDDIPSDVAIAANGLAIFRGFGQWQPYRQIDLSTDTISKRSSDWSIYGGSLIARSSDRSLLFITQGGISSGPIATYDATTNTFSPEKDTNTYLATSLSAVNRNGSLIALEWGTGISILDRNLNSVENLTNVDGGLAFDPTRDVLYAASSASNQIIAYNTNTWKELYRFNIGENIRPTNAYDDPSQPLGNGVMVVSDDGNHLFMSTSQGVRAFDLRQVSGDLQAYSVSVGTGQAVTGLNFGNQQIPAFSVNDVSIVEGDSGTRNAVFTVALSVAGTQPITVNYATADGTAIAGSDYTATSGTLTFAPGELSKTVAVPILGDTLVEPDETFSLNLSNPSSGNLIADAQGIGTIVNDDPKLSIANAAIAEGNSGTSTMTFTVSLSGAANQPITVNYATANNTAIAGIDYTATSSTLTFAPGETRKTINVAITGDTFVENDEAFQVILSNPTNAALATSQAVGTILNDDSSPLVTGETQRVSVASDGIQANNSSFTFPAISANGRYVAFQSNASNLVAGDTNGVADVFVRDLVTGETTRVSVATDGSQGNGPSGDRLSISADGRYVAFSSVASNLVTGDTNLASDIFVHDRLTGETTRISTATDGSQGNSSSTFASISGDGRYVAFESDATNLVPGDTNLSTDIFVHDRLTGETTRVSVATNGTQANSFSDEPAISADGRYVVYGSYASNLVPGDTNGVTDVFVYDRTSGTTRRVSVASDGTQGNGFSPFATISGDGRYIAFGSEATNLVPGDTNNAVDNFIFDQVTGQTTRISVASDGTQANSDSGGRSISADGNYVAFWSAASNLVAGDTNNAPDIFLYNRITGETTRVSVASDGTQGDSSSGGSGNSIGLSADGRYVVFSSSATNLVPGDTNGFRDIFVRDRGTA